MVMWPDSPQDWNENTFTFFPVCCLATNGSLWTYTCYLAVHFCLFPTLIFPWNIPNAHLSAPVQAGWTSGIYKGLLVICTGSPKVTTAMQVVHCHTGTLQQQIRISASVDKIVTSVYVFIYVPFIYVHVLTSTTAVFLDSLFCETDPSKQTQPMCNQIL